jgi:hypothetical protein
MIRVVEAHPTASIRRRAAHLAEVLEQTAGDEGPIHLVGHSTGGLDARLVASPAVHLRPGGGARERAAHQLSCLDRLCSVTTMNTPHHGTPLAAFFATVSGQKMLYAVSALTVTALKLGQPPLAAASALLALIGRVGLGAIELQLIDRSVDSIVRVLDDASSQDLTAWLGLLKTDQGAMVQLMPEAMDLFQAGIEDRANVRYQSVATYAPLSGVTDWISALRSPWGAVSATIFTALYNVTARQDAGYPCAPPDGSAQRAVRALLGEQPPDTASDGVVPLYSQVYGDLVWAGKADHLDVVGHFPGPGGHTDWLSSGARFNRVRFEAMLDRVVAGMILSEEQRAWPAAREGSDDRAVANAGDAP